MHWVRTYLDDRLEQMPTYRVHASTPKTSVHWPVSDMLRPASAIQPTPPLDKLKPERAWGQKVAAALLGAWGSGSKV